MYKSLAFSIILSIVFFSCSMPKFNPDTTQAIKSLHVDRYMGKWYEIYRLPMRAEKDLVNVTATYTLRNDNRIDVLNEGYKHHTGGKHKKAKALAWQPNPEIDGALIVRFFGLFKADYLILALDDDYQWAVVSTLSRKYAWVLAREPAISTDLEQKLLDTAQSFNIDTSRFIKTVQQW